MNHLRHLSIPLLILLNLHAHAGILKGKVTDERGVALPYATIYLEGTTVGVNANGNGDYILTVAPGLYKVVCQYVGYTRSSFNLSVAGDETTERTFVLQGLSLDLKETVVHANAEDPAYAIIRNAIKKRKFHLNQVKSFQTAIYLKGVARSRKLPKKIMGKPVKDETDVLDSNGKGVLYLTEEYADYYSQGNKEKTVIHSVHESGDPSGLGFSQFPSVITFYENNVDVFGNNSRGFISPISENALFYYRYKLLGEFSEQGHTIYKIQVKQKRNYEPCFNGTIYIVDEDWAIHSLNLTLTKQSGIDLVDTMRVDQLFLPLQKDTWVVKSQVLYFTLNLLGFDITGTGVTVYNNQKVNEAIPDSIFAGKVISAYDKAANKKDTAYWLANRPIQLETDEKHDFVAKDSLRLKLASPEHRDSLRKKQNKFKPLNMLRGSVTFTGKNDINTYTLNPVLLSLSPENMVNYNIVEGFNLAPKLSITHRLDTAKNLHIDIMVRYGFSNTHFNSIGRIYYQEKDRSFLNRMWLCGIEGGKYVFQYNPENPVLTWYNTYEALFARENDLKLYERWEASGFAKRNYGNGLSWYVRASYQKRMPLFNTTDYSFINGDKSGFTDNTPAHLREVVSATGINDAALVYASASYRPGYTYTQYPDYKVAHSSSWPSFTLTYEKGIPGIFNSVSDFDKYRFSIQGDAAMKLLGTLKYNLAVGGFLNSNFVAIPDLMHLYGNRGIGFASPYLNSFQFAPYYEFSNAEPVYGEGHLEYHLNGLLSNKIPLLRQARYYLVLGGNAFYARQSDYYTEAFVGIDNIGWKLVRVGRIDFVQSWDSHGGHNSGIRYGLNFGGQSLVVRNNPTGSEW